MADIVVVDCKIHRKWKPELKGLNMERLTHRDRWTGGKESEAASPGTVT